MKLATLAIGVLLAAAPAHAEIRASFVPHTSDALQSALTLSQPGDEIVLDPGTEYVGHFQLPAKPFGLPITVRSSATLPDRRVTKDDAALMPVIRSETVEAALFGTGITGWRFDGLFFKANAFGAGNIIELQDATNIYIDRLLILGGDDGQKRAILGNGRQITVTRSYIGNVWHTGEDSQAFCAWDGGGPYTITDNYLEAASENVMFGGADSSSPANVPADIVVEDNTLFKPLEWKGLKRVIKNNFELKSAKRVRFRRNIVKNNWGDEGQGGPAVVITPRNQDGRAPWSVVEDVLIEANIISNAPAVFNVIGYDNEAFSLQTNRIRIRNNILEEVPGFALMVSGEIKDLEYSGNVGGALVNLDKGGIRPVPETAWREAKYAVESFSFFQNSSLWLRSDTANGELAVQQNTVRYSLTGIVEPPQPVDPCVLQPAALSSPKSFRWPGATNGEKFLKATFYDRRNCPATITR